MIKNITGRTFLKTYLFRATLVIFTVLCQCHKHNEASATTPAFDSVPTSKVLTPLVSEISGIADSKLNPGYLWGEEDSGNPSQLYLISHDGVVVKKIFLKGITNRDWEDMALFNGDIYIAETGDNGQLFSSYKFYRFPEPPAAADTVTVIETINFTYPDGSHDAEAFLIDSATKNIYIITKRDDPSKIYRLSYPYNAPGNTVALVGSLPYTGVVSAAVQRDEIIIKTYTSLFYYKRRPGQNIEQSLKNSYISLPYAIESQGEAVGFAINGSGFYTISEKGFASEVKIYYYKRR